MRDKNNLLLYIKEGVLDLLAAGTFENGTPFRPTQKKALEIYDRYLSDTTTTLEQKLKGYMEIATGLGKTALFTGIIAAAHQAAERHHDHLKSIIVVPTIPLLGQTKDAITQYAPHLTHRIGLYGNGYKDLHHQVTVMTYDAWYDLSQSGEIGSHNIDILISDEAHRGTSKRRVENIAGVFNDASTVQLAFTATAHFDRDKSVLRTHAREIFYKSPREGILSGELCAYAQRQGAIIRVDPENLDLINTFEPAAEGDFDTVFRKVLRENAWNDFAHKVFREGIDEHTGDPLSDNDAGFFVSSIRQADRLETRLNADPVLRDKAVALGKQGVAVAIHSELSKGEQKRRFDAYRTGHYMAVIGDDMFKEGFDHPPMKTIIDSPHASVVDKAQILGRGARQWWNEAKFRYEGLTIIDTVVYIGSKDTKENDRLRATALRKAVSVQEILEESYVLAPGIEVIITTGDGIKRPFDFDPDVEYYTEHEDVYRLDAEISRLRREDTVPISEIGPIAREHVKRTGVGGTIVNRSDCPEGLTENMVNNILAKSSNSVTFRQNHWEWLKARWEKMPSRPSVSIPISTIRPIAQEQAKRTGVSKSLTKRPDCPKDLTKGMIGSLLSEACKQVSFRQDHWEWLKARWEEMPSSPSVSKIPISTIRTIAREQRDRTGVGQRIVRQPGCPEGLTAGIVSQILSKSTLTVYIREDYWLWLKKTWEGLSAKPGYVPPQSDGNDEPPPASPFISHEPF